jgi:O-antigen/teichoic acid export membrane protein
MIMTSTNVNILGYFIEHHLGTGHLGLSSAVASLQQIAASIPSSSAQATTPHLARCHAARHLADYRRPFSKLIGAGVLIAVSGLAVFFVAGRPILRLPFARDHAGLPGLLPCLMLAGGIWTEATFFGASATIERRFCYQLFVLLAANIAMLTACWCYVPEHGLRAAAVAATLSAAVVLMTFAEPLLTRLRPRLEVRS